MNGKSKKWNSDKTIKFLELYEGFPCLWDVKSEDYKNRKARENAYSKMTTAMDIKGFITTDVKAKIRSLRNAYTLELSKMIKSKKPGAGSNKIYKPKVVWFGTADRILRKVVQIRDSEPTGTQIQQDGDWTDEEMSSPTVNDVITPTSSSSASEMLKNIGATDKALENLKKISETLHQPQSEKNEFDYFGMTVVCQLKKLPEPVALESMAYIQSYLVRQRLKSQQSTEHNHLLTSFENQPSSAGSCE